MTKGEDDRRTVERGDFKRRETPRQRCLLGGLLVRAKADHVQRVSVRNLSLTGAKLVLDDRSLVHPEMVLVIPKLESAWEVELIWRELPEAGVRFIRSLPMEAEPQLRSALRAIAA